jgi:hypothetical protein
MEVFIRATWVYGAWRVEIFNHVFGIVGLMPWSLGVAMVLPVTP